MSLKLFISGKYLSVGWIILYLAGIYLTGHSTAQPTGEPCTGLLAPGAGQWFAPTLLNRLLNALFVLVGGVLLLRINNRFSLIQRHTLLPFLFFLLFELVSPSLTLLGDGNVTAVVLLLLCILFFHAYQSEKAQPAFLIMFTLALCTLFCTRYIYYVPLFLIGFAQMRCLSIKSLLGALVGLITPFWIGVGLDWIPASQLTRLLPDFDFTIPQSIPYDNPQLWIVVLTALLGLFSGTTMLYSTFNEKRQIRAYNGFTNLLSVYAALLLIVDYRNYTLYLPVLNAAVAMQAASFFTNNGGKKPAVISFYLVLTLYIALFLWYLLPA